MNKGEIKKQCCPNRTCKAYGKFEHGNIKVHDLRKNRFRCELCGKTWVGNYGQCSFGLKKNLVVVNRAFEMLKAGISIRRIAKFSHVSPSTVVRWKKKFLSLNNY